MKFLVSATAALAAVVALSGCGAKSHAAPPPPSATVGHQGEQEFLPTYVDQLTGKKPFPVDQCQPHDLASLLAPCDEPGSK